jgi:hypothetical protein
VGVHPQGEFQVCRKISASCANGRFGAAGSAEA